MVKPKKMQKALRKTQVKSGYRGFTEKRKRSEARQKENMRY